MDAGLIERIRRMETMSMAEGEGCLCPCCGGTGLTETNSGNRTCRCCGGKGYTDAPSIDIRSDACFVHV